MATKHAKQITHPDDFKPNTDYKIVQRFPSGDFTTTRTFIGINVVESNGEMQIGIRVECILGHRQTIPWKTILEAQEL